MNAVETMKYTNDIALDIAKKLGILAKYGVLSAAYCQNIIFDISQMQLKWMNKNFTPEEFSDFLDNLRQTD